MLKKLLSLALAPVLLLSLCACAPSAPTEPDTTTQFTSGGFALSVPNEYADLLIVDTSVEGQFFHVSEKASVEAAWDLFPDDETVGGGFLFGIGQVSQDEFYEMMMYGMTGADVFARDGNGNYYIYYHPTDVQLLRLEYTDTDWELWADLCEWAGQMKQTFIDDNPGLTGYERTYSDIDCVLHHIVYGEKTARLTTKYVDVIYEPDLSQPLPYLDQLLVDVLYFTYSSGELNPEGNYISLAVPDALPFTSFDFFIDEGQQQYIRQNFDDIEPVYYVASRNGEEFPVGQVVADWLTSLN